MQSDYPTMLVFYDNEMKYGMLNFNDTLSLVSNYSDQVPYHQALFIEKLPGESFIIYIPDYDTSVYDPFPPNVILNHNIKYAITKDSNNHLSVNRDENANPLQFFIDASGFIRNYAQPEEYMCIQKQNSPYFPIMTNNPNFKKLRLYCVYTSYIPKGYNGELISNAISTKINYTKYLKQNENPKERAVVDGKAKTIDTVKSGISMTMLFKESNGYSRYSYIDDDGWVQMVPQSGVTYDTQGYFSRGQILYKHPSRNGVFYLSEYLKEKQWYYLKKENGDYQDQRWENAGNQVPLCRDGAVFNNYYIRRQADSKAQPTWFIFDDQNRVYEMKSDGTPGDELTFVYSGGKCYLGFGGSKATFAAMYDEDNDGTFENTGESGYES